MLRSFIAFDLEEEKTKKNIIDFIERLKLNQSRTKFVEPENLHMTLKFLDNISESLAPKIYHILKEEINGTFFKDKTQKFVLKGTGQFKNYSILWIKLVGDISFLQSIKNQVEELLENKFEIKKDNRIDFKPHMTIGRLKKKQINYKTFNSFKTLIKENKDTEFGLFHIDKVKLKKSVLTPKGPIYSDLEY